MRVVLDTNVLVSALLWDGNEQDVLNLCCSGELRSVTSLMILSELSRVLRDKFKRSEDEVLDYIHEIEMVSELFLPTGTMTRVQSDPDDDIVLETALVGDADVIITGDSHLLALKGFMEVEIQNSREFLKSMSK